MKSPPSPFAEAFRLHVIPGLRAEIIVQAASVASGAAYWSDAHSAVMRLAIARGAAMLRDQHFRDLNEWAGAVLLAEIDAAELLIAEANALVATLIHLPLPLARPAIAAYLAGGHV